MQLFDFSYQRSISLEWRLKKLLGINAGKLHLGRTEEWFCESHLK
jgi:hypothetical protein